MSTSRYGTSNEKVKKMPQQAEWNNGFELISPDISVEGSDRVPNLDGRSPAAWYSNNRMPSPSLGTTEALKTSSSRTLLLARTSSSKVKPSVPKKPVHLAPTRPIQQGIQHVPPEEDAGLQSIQNERLELEKRIETLKVEEERILMIQEKQALVEKLKNLDQKILEKEVTCRQAVERQPGHITGPTPMRGVNGEIEATTRKRQDREEAGRRPRNRVESLRRELEKGEIDRMELEEKERERQRQERQDLERQEHKKLQLEQKKRLEKECSKPRRERHQLRRQEFERLGQEWKKECEEEELKRKESKEKVHERKEGERQEMGKKALAQSAKVEELASDNEDEDMYRSPTVSAPMSSRAGVSSESINVEKPTTNLNEASNRKEINPVWNETSRPEFKFKERYHKAAQHQYPLSSSPISPSPTPTQSNMPTPPYTTSPMKTDEDIAWDLVGEAKLSDPRLQSCHPMLRKQMREAVLKYMPAVEFSNALKSPKFPTGPTSNRIQLPTLSKEFGNDAASFEEERCYCGRYGPTEMTYYFCWPCRGTIYCDQCWDQCPPHRPRRSNGAAPPGPPHEKTDPMVAGKIFKALESNLDDEDQAFLHVQDEDTLWFGTGKDDGDYMVFQDLGRYARLMAEKSTQKRTIRYPALVSFVGQTGAGKSSLIRLLIELYAPPKSQLQVPVIGSNLHQDVPTSGDVHLYADMKTFYGDQPILYADCEGLDGGEREPMGARSRMKRGDGSERAHRTPSFTRHIRKQHHTTEREIAWATTDKTRSREYHVRHLYPRLLYTLSDVIVFVMKNPRVIENVIEQLVKWAAAALETSSNQPVLPHAIIVLNAFDSTSDPALWDVDASTIDLMDSVRRAVHQNHSMRQYAEFWRERERFIESVEMLILSYYSSIRVVRVPEKGRPNLINAQLEKLYQEITEACERSRDSKHEVRMLLNSDELQPYLRFAFDHFCTSLDTPFDFVQASFNLNPIPSDFGGNILKLAINIMEVWQNRIDGPTIFNELGMMVASCIMLDSVRHRTLGPAERVFPEYIDYCDDALDDFCNRHWPCEYVHPITYGRCVNVRAGHQSKGHQLRDGRVLAVGQYQSDFTAEGYHGKFRNDIYLNLARLLEKLQEATRGSAHLELQKAAEIHRDSVLQPFYRHLEGAGSFISHTACFSCLTSSPDHALPCGHVICTPCARAFGAAQGKCVIEITYCPLHRDDKSGRFRCWPLFVKPPGAGIRILSLDGGGVRGIVELMILQEIERALGPGLPIQAFLDLIVGTSTGGIIALGLGANGWSVQLCTENFERLCEQAFTRRKGIGFPGIELFISATNFSRYETQPLEKALKGAFGECTLFAGSWDGLDKHRDPRRLTKVAVTTTTTAATAALLANYNRNTGKESTDYQFLRSEKPAAEIKTWQAARATSAAPTIFRPFVHDPTGQVFQDGAIHHNNPVEIAMQERKLIWPDVANLQPDIILSVGTSYNPTSRRHAPQADPPAARGGIFSNARALTRLAVDCIASSLNSEAIWKRFLTQNAPPLHLKDRYIRLNLELQKDPPRLDDLRSVSELKEQVLLQFGMRRESTKIIADRLLASSFYFEPVADGVVVENEDNSVTHTGNILCRFAPASPELCSLGKAIRQRSKDAYNKSYEVYFVIRERLREQYAQQVKVTSSVVDNMMYEGCFSIEPIHVQVSHKRAETEILLCFTDQLRQPIFYHISGFPKCLWGNEPISALRRNASVPLRHQRIVTSVKQKEGWQSSIGSKLSPIQSSESKLSSLESKPTSYDLLEAYNRPSYHFPGNSTPADISGMADRFIVHPLSPPLPAASAAPPLEPDSPKRPQKSFFGRFTRRSRRSSHTDDSVMDQRRMWEGKWPAWENPKSTNSTNYPDKMLPSMSQDVERAYEPVQTRPSWRINGRSSISSAGVRSMATPDVSSVAGNYYELDSTEEAPLPPSLPI